MEMIRITVSLHHQKREIMLLIVKYSEMTEKLVHLYKLWRYDVAANQALIQTVL